MNNNKLLKNKIATIKDIIITNAKNEIMELTANLCLLHTNCDKTQKILNVNFYFISCNTGCYPFIKENLSHVLVESASYMDNGYVSKYESSFMEYLLLKELLSYEVDYHMAYSMYFPELLIFYDNDSDGMLLAKDLLDTAIKESMDLLFYHKNKIINKVRKVYSNKVGWDVLLCLRSQSFDHYQHLQTKNEYIRLKNFKKNKFKTK